MLTNRITPVIAMMATLVLGTTVSLSAQAQARGSGQSKGRSTATGQPSGQRGQTGQPTDQRRGGLKDQKRIHASNEQRDQLQTCTGTAEQIRQRARDLTRSAGDPGFNADQGRKQRDQLRDQIQTMQQNQERLLQGLNQEQKAQWQKHISVMDQQRDRVQKQLQTMDQEFGQASLNRQRVSQQAREIERAMKEWQKQYRAMNAEMYPNP